MILSKYTDSEANFALLFDVIDWTTRNKKGKSVKVAILWDPIEGHKWCFEGIDRFEDWQS